MSAEVIIRLLACFKTNLAKTLPKNMNKKYPGLFLCRYTYLLVHNSHIVCSKQQRYSCTNSKSYWE